MDWSTALEKQAEVASSLRASVTSRLAAQDFFGEKRDNRIQILRRSLQYSCEGEAIWVEPDIVQALGDEAEHVPDDWMLTADMLVAAPAFCWLGKPVAYARMADGTELPIVAFSWCVIKDAEGRSGLNVLVFTQTNFTYPLAWFGWDWGGRLGDRIDWLMEHRGHNNENARVNWGTELRLFAALIEFMSQKIVERSRRHPDRATRRRMGFQPEETPLVTVVTLRRKKYQKPEQGEEPAFGYSHRFVVRSHWRKQWYPSLGTHRPRLITSYVKGPEDRPLVLKRRVFDLAR